MVKSWIYFTTGTIMASTFRAMFGPAGFLELVLVCPLFRHWFVPGTNGITAPTMVQIYFPWCLEIIRKVAPITLARDLQTSDLRVSTKCCNIWARPLLVLKLPHSSMKLTHAWPNRCQIVGRHQNTWSTLNIPGDLEGSPFSGTHTHTYIYIYII